MPAAMASATVSDSRATPSIAIVPPDGATTPPRIFIRVDLPAPFSPISPTTSPRPAANETSRSACVAPKALGDVGQSQEGLGHVGLTVERERPKPRPIAVCSLTSYPGVP